MCVFGWVAFSNFVVFELTVSAFWDNNLPIAVC